MCVPFARNAFLENVPEAPDGEAKDRRRREKAGRRAAKQARREERRQAPHVVTFSCEAQRCYIAWGWLRWGPCRNQRDRDGRVTFTACTMKRRPVPIN